MDSRTCRLLKSSAAFIAVMLLAYACTRSTTSNQTLLTGDAATRVYVP